MKKNIKYLLLVIPVFLFSCKEKEKTDYKFETTINTTNIKKTLSKDDEIIDSIDYVKLETLPGSEIGEIKRIEYLGGNYVIYDKRNKLLLVFDQKGKFLNKIGQSGKCLDCFANIDDFTVDKKKKHIVVMDLALQRILTFDLSGKIVQRDKLPEVYPTSIGLLGDKYVYYKNKSRAFDMDRNENDIVIAKGNKVFKEYFPYDDSFTSWYAYKPSLYYSNDTLNFINNWEGKIFGITQDGIKPRFHILFGKNTIPLDYTKTQADFERNNPKKFNYLYLNFLENKDEVTFQYTEGELVKLGIYFKSSANFYVVQASEFKIAVLNPIATKDNQFISVVNPEEMVRYASELKTPYLSKITKGMKATDNPILVLHTLKAI